MPVLKKKQSITSAAPTQVKAKQPLSIPQRIARAADLEGMLTKHVVRFEDLRKKYFIPSTFTPEDVSDGHDIQRLAVIRTINTYTVKNVTKVERTDDAPVTTIAEEE